MKNLRWLMLAGISGLMLLSSCLKKLQEGPNHSFKLTFDTVRVTQGITQYLAAKDWDAADITWSSSDTTVATIDPRGVITGIRAGQATLSAVSKLYKTSAKCVVIVLGKTFAETTVSDVAVSNNGSIFAIGTDVVSPTGGFGIYKVNGDKLDKLPYCAGVRIAVDPTGRPWVVNKSHLVFRYRDTTQAWEQLPGTANDIAIAANGAVFIVSNTPSSNGAGYKVMRWNGTDWTVMVDCPAVRIATDANAVPWVVDASHKVLAETNGSSWTAMGTVSANDIAIGTNGFVFASENATTNPQIFKYNAGSWTATGFSGTSIAVRPNGSLVWIDTNNVLHLQ